MNRQAPIPTEQNPANHNEPPGCPPAEWPDNDPRHTARAEELKFQRAAEEDEAEEEQPASS